MMKIQSGLTEPFINYMHILELSRHILVSPTSETNEDPNDRV